MKRIDIEKERIERYFSDKYSDDDVKYISRLFCDDTKERELRFFLSGQFSRLLNTKEDKSEDIDLTPILYRLNYEINNRRKQKDNRFSFHINRWILPLTSIVALLLVVFISFRISYENKLYLDYWVEVKAPAWTRVQFKLPDGTNGWLTSNSSLRYDGNFAVHRQVTLSGEGFFDVVADKKRPFVVNTSEVTVKVLGTRFNIAAYENEDEVEVVLEEGQLIFSDKHQINSYIMKPTDMAVYNKANKDLFIQTVQTQKYSSWTDGKLIFRNDSIDVIAKKLKRWYNVNIDVELPSSADIRWRATFIDEDIECVLDFLKRSYPLDYIIEDPFIGSDSTYFKKKIIIIPKHHEETLY